MRPLFWLLVCAGLVVLLAAPAGPLGSVTSARTAPAPAEGAAGTPAAAPASNPLAATDWNTTEVAPSAGGGPPTSAYFTTPAPVVPDTKPVVMYFANNSVATATTSCCVFANFTAPVGDWAMIVLNYTGRAEIAVFDSSYRAYIDQSMVLFGTTPEYGTWTVLKDITEYSALFHGTFNLSFFMSAAIPSGTGGYFLSNFSIAFYPVPAGGHAPREPGTIVPFWFRQLVSTSNPVVFTDATVPSNATNATLELYAYGFGNDEFWYRQQPGARSIEVAENGTDLALVLPFPYLNTGGVDLYTWRPVTGVFTLNDRPYELNETAALGFLEGSRNFTARLNGVAVSSNWIVAGSLLLYTNASATASQPTSYVWSAPAPVVHSSAGTYDETQAASYNYSSLVGLPAGAVNVTLNRTVVYSSVSTSGQTWLSQSWSNVTANEASDTVVTSDGPTGPVTANATTVFEITMDQGNNFIESSSTGGTYPYYGNYTTYFDNVHQQWSESLQVTGPSPADAYFEAVVGQDTAPTNYMAGSEELISATAAIILSTTSVQSETDQLYGQDVAAPDGGGLYNHLIEAAALDPPAPYFAETVLVNEASSPLVAAVAFSAPTVDTGHALGITAAVSGGTGPFSVTWTGLPPGCAGASSLTLSCAPTLSGIYLVGASVVGAGGAVALAPGATVVVNPAPTVSLTAASTVSDVGLAVNVSALVAGGTPAVRCAWTIGGASTGPATSCATPLSVTRSTMSVASVDVTVTDALGVTAAAPSPLVLSFGAPPSIVVEPVANVTPYVDHPVTLTALTTGGAGAVSIVWTVNGTAVPGATGATFTFVPFGAATYSVGATVVDAAGGTAFSAPVTLTAKAAPATTGNSPSSGGGSGSSALSPLAYLVVGVAIGVVGGVLLMVLARPGRPSARRRGPPPPRPAYDEGG